MYHKHSPEQTTTKRSPPPWQVLDLVAHHLDPTSLAAASCVCKSWSTALSADHLWQPVCDTTYPSLSNLRPTNFRKLYSLGRAADTRRRQTPPKPLLSMKNIFFAIDIRNSTNTIATVFKPCSELEIDKNGVFRFDIDVDAECKGDVAMHGTFDEVDGLRVTWNVVLEGYKGVFTVMDCKGKGKFVLGLEGWFSKELPASGCCAGGGGSGLVADLRVGLREVGGGKVKVEKMSVGMLSMVSWRYVLVEDALRYLQHFLLH